MGVSQNGILSSTEQQRNQTNDEVRNDKHVYVHPSIQSVLTMEPCSTKKGERRNSPLFVDETTFTIQWDEFESFLQEDQRQESSSIISMSQLVTLAFHSEMAFIHNDSWREASLPRPIRGLLGIIPAECLGDERTRSDEDKGGEYFLLATLLALNMVENSIRNLLGKRNGRAPLLKDMIDELALRQKGTASLPEPLVPLLRTLLLPKNGLNLRNLLWHGFLPTIHPRWFSLAVALCLSLDRLGSSSFEGHFNDKSIDTIKEMRNHERLAAILNHGNFILSSRDTIASLESKLIESNVLPASHVDLWKTSLRFVHHPTIFASVAGPMIEHILRLLWCHENQQEKRIAEPESYYVTLDGHGQKDKHEVMIMPFLSTPGLSETRNKLVYRLGGSTMAFLMDIFSSPPGAPNIRASMAHGSFNEYLFDDLSRIEENGGIPHKNHDDLFDLSRALLAVFSILSEIRSSGANCPSDVKSNLLSSYRPCLSYSSLLLLEVKGITKAMKPFYDTLRNGKHVDFARMSPISQMQIDVEEQLLTMSKSIDDIVLIQDKIFQGFGAAGSNFTDEDFFDETRNNRVASECGAAKLLLSEISQAVFTSNRQLNDAIATLESEDIQLSSRRRKQAYRVCSSAKLTLDFYSFTAYCALLYIEHHLLASAPKSQNNVDISKNKQLTEDQLFIAVKRSRMVLSTISTTKTFDRALSALKQYMVGKAVKAIIES